MAGRAIIDIVDWCKSGSHWENGKLFLLNMPSADSRKILTERVRKLHESFKQHDRHEIIALILDMMSSYEASQQNKLSAAQRKADAVIYVRELEGVPTWAIAEACSKIRLGTAPDISHQFKPTPIQVRVLAVSVAQPFKEEVLRITSILSAEKWREPLSAEENAKVGALLRGLADNMRAEVQLERDREHRERLAKTAPRIKAQTEAFIRAEYAAAGEEPRAAGDLLVSKSLVKLIGARKTAAPVAEPSREPPMDVPF